MRRRSGALRLITPLLLCTVILYNTPGTMEASMDTPSDLSASNQTESSTLASVVTLTTTLGSLIPMPVSVQPAEGTFTFTVHAQIYVETGNAEVKAVGQYLADKLNPASGFKTQVTEASAIPAAGNIYLTTKGADASLGDEGYMLTITPDLVTVAANKPAGLFYGIQTIRQLFPPAIESQSPQQGSWELPAATIKDYPRFGWRGAMLDVSRHFFGVDDVKQYIDLLAYFKINRFHLHLSDDQGWRIEIKAWPNLTAFGGKTEVGGGEGGFYTQEQYIDIVTYAQSRYVMIIPEIDMPGHTNAALASYAELNCNDKAPTPYTGTEVGFSSFCIDKEITYKFIDDVVKELAALTPGPYIHIGGDEARATPDDDYVKFVNRVQDIVIARGKVMVGWEEIGRSKLLPSSIAQRWNTGESNEVVTEAVQQGAKIILSPADKAYVDMKYDRSTPLGLNWAGYVSVQHGYSWDPATEVDGISEADIVGVEAPLWAETIITLDDIEYMAFPRMLGYAEMGWSQQDARDWNTYKLRLAAQGPRLTALGVNFYQAPEVSWE